MTYSELESLKKYTWNKVNNLIDSLSNTAKSMSRQQKQHYMSIYGVSIYEKIRVLEYILHSDEEFSNDYFLAYFPHEFLNDLEVMEDALILHPGLITCAGKDVVNNLEIAKNIIAVDGWYIEYLSDELKNNKEIVTAATYNDSIVSLLHRRSLVSPFYFASDELKNDKEYVMGLLDVVSNIFELTSNSLKDDEEVVFKACKNLFYQFKFASDRIKNDVSFLRTLLDSDIMTIPEIRPYINKALLDKLTLEVFEKDPTKILTFDFERIDFIFEHYTKEYINNLMLKLSQKVNKQDPYALKYIDSKINGTARKREKE